MAFSRFGRYPCESLGHFDAGLAPNHEPDRPAGRYQPQLTVDDVAAVIAVEVDGPILSDASSHGASVTQGAASVLPALFGR